MVCADEKGFTNRGVTNVSCVVTREACRAASTAAGDASFGHVSLVSWAGLDGARYASGCVVKWKQWHPDWAAILPGALVEPTGRGAVAAEIFRAFLKE